MPNREEIHNCAENLLVATVTSTGAVIDTAGVDCDGFDSCHFTIATNSGGASGATYKVQESDDNSTFTDAASTSYVDDGDPLTASKAKRVAYVGNKRYARLEITPAATNVLTVFAHRGYAAKKPVPNPS